MSAVPIIFFGPICRSLETQYKKDTIDKLNFAVRKGIFLVQSHKTTALVLLSQQELYTL